MRVVELNLVLGGELRPVVGVVLLVATNDVTKGGGTEEVLLLQAKLLATLTGVVGIQH